MRRRDFIVLCSGANMTKIAVCVMVAMTLANLLSVVDSAFAQKRTATSTAPAGRIPACFDQCFKQCVSVGGSNASCSRRCYPQCSGVVGDQDNRY
jgi:hypothetical protein